MSWDRECDLIAVGSGLGGLSAALAAHDAGGDVVVLEKAPKLEKVVFVTFCEVF